MVFWVGVMMGRPKAYNNIHEKMDFKEVKSNFFSAARNGMGTQFFWNGSYVSSHSLILNEFLPIAYKGLNKVGVNTKDVEYYLKIIQNRVNSNNGSQWMIKSYRNLLKSKKRFEASHILTAEIYKKQQKEYPVSTWNLVNQNTASIYIEKRIIKHVMSTDIFSVYENDSVALVIHIMKWKGFHHMPVINSSKEIIGLLTWTNLSNYITNKKNHLETVKNIMKKEIITINQYKSLSVAKDIMKQNNISCLPVVKERKLIGMITTKDI